MKINIVITFIVLFLQASWARSSDGMLWRSRLGDARGAMQADDIIISDQYHGGQYRVVIPEGRWNDLTFTFWIRLFNPADIGKSAEALFSTIVLRYCPEKIQRLLPDALEGAGHWGSNTYIHVNGSVSFPFDFYPDASYTNAIPTETDNTKNKHGAYTVNAITDAPLTLSMGGEEYVLKGGTNVFNTYGGVSPYVIVAGQGNFQLGVSRMYWHQYFMRVNGVAELDEYGEQTPFLTKSSIVTNETVFVSCRLHLSETAHHTRDDLWHYDSNDQQGLTITNTLPANADCRAFDSRGEYYVGIIGLDNDRYEAEAGFRNDIYDFRVYTEWLTEEDLIRNFMNGREDMEHRGIPKNKGY